MGVHSDVGNEHGGFWVLNWQNKLSRSPNKPSKNPPVHSYIKFSPKLKPPSLKSEHPIH